jgi:hypothetical protein
VAAVLVAVVVLATCTAVPAWAQQRPLVTQDPETIGNGRLLVDAGFDYGRDVNFPFSGLTGNLTRFPLLTLDFGLGSYAELQLSGGPYDRLSITKREKAPFSDVIAPGDTTSDVDDIVVATKIRAVSETATRPGFGVRFAMRLPNANQDNGIGTNTFDFASTVLVGKTLQSTRYVGNVGLLIAGDPTVGTRQSDLLVYGLSIARAVHEGVEIVGELNGRGNFAKTVHPAGESRSGIRVGTRFARGAGRVDAGLVFGLTARDPSVGFTVGYTYVFQIF